MTHEQKKESPHGVVIFDLDHTITSWDTGTGFFSWLILRAPWRFGLVLVTSPFVLLAFLGRQPILRLIRSWIWIATLFRTHEQVVDLARVHVERLRRHPSKQIRSEGIAEIQEYQRKGVIVVIATGTFEPLAREILRPFGLGNTPLVASTLRPFAGGWVADDHCYGPHKLAMLKARGFGPPWRVTYTDHHSDIPLIQAGEKCFLVNPKKKTLERVARLALANITVVNWGA